MHSRNTNILVEVLVILLITLLVLNTWSAALASNRTFFRLTSAYFRGNIGLILGHTDLPANGCSAAFLRANLTPRNGNMDSQDDPWLAAIRSCGTRPYVLIRAGDFYFSAGQFDRAANVWRHTDQSQQYLTNQIQSAVENLDWDQVIAYSDALLAIDPTDLMARYSRGRAYLQQGNWIAAEFDLAQATKPGQGNAMEPDVLSDALFWLGRTYRYLDKSEEANVALTTAVALDPTNSMAYVDLALVEREKDIEAARAFAEKAVEADHQNVWAYLTLGELDLEAGDFHNALAQARSAIALQPSSNLPYLLASSAAYRANDIGMAISIIDAGLQSSTAKSDLLCQRYRFTQSDQGAPELSKTLALLETYSISPESCVP